MRRSEAGAMSQVVERAAPLSKVVFSRKSDEWGTPIGLFRELDERFSFELDVAASDDNALCDCWFTAENSALDHEWGDYRSAFCNPPYSQCREFVTKCAEQAAKHRMTVVVLVPARTDTRWFHEHVYGKRGVTVDFLKGRLKFGDSTNSAPFPSMLVVFHGPCMERAVEPARTVAAVDPVDGVTTGGPRA
jgi:phage N-6-adenine-methyltransferase